MTDTRLALTISHAEGFENVPDHHHIVLSHERLTLRIRDIKFAYTFKRLRNAGDNESEYDVRVYSVTFDVLDRDEIGEVALSRAQITLQLEESSVPRIGELVTFSLGAIPVEFLHPSERIDALEPFYRPGADQ